MFFFSSRRRHTRWPRDWSSDVCSSDLRAKGRTELLTVGCGCADADTGAGCQGDRVLGVNGAEGQPQRESDADAKRFHGSPPAPKVARRSQADFKRLSSCLKRGLLTS